MTNLRAHKRWIYVGIFLHLTGCSVESGSDGSTSAPTTTSSGTARVELSSDAISVDYDGSVTLSWTTNRVEDCVALGDWSGDKNTSGTETISSLVANSTFELACTEIDAGANSRSTLPIAYKGRKIKDTVDVAVKGPKPPALSVSASSTTVPVNGSTTISWSSQRASDCEASGGWSGNRATSGTESISGLTANSTFILTCNGKGGSAEDSASISIVAPSAPWASLAANSSSLPYGGSTTLSWDSGNTSGCSASGDWSGSLATAGTRSTGALMADSTFTLTCSGTGGSVNETVNVTVAAPLPTLSFTASPGAVNTNGSATLSWAGTDVTSCTASGDWSGNKAAAGAETINAIAADSQFTLTCSGTGGSVNKAINVTVSQSSNGTALLSWTPPTRNTDDSPLQDLAGYKIRYGTSPGNYSETITVSNPGLSSYLVENLVAAEWFFVMTSFNTSSIESVYSLEVSKTID